MEIYPGKSEYLAELDKRGHLPRGFKTSVRQIQFTPAEMPGSTLMPMNLTLLSLDEATDAFAGVFTHNAFPGAPVIIGRELMERALLKGILVNNKIANVSTANGVDDAMDIVTELARADNGQVDQYLPASTGVIGWSLPVDDIKNELAHLVHDLEYASISAASRAIMTTDAYPKVRSAVIGEGRIVAIAKGAGMIEPNMGTMLVFILTDVDVPREDLRRCLRASVDKSFNRISIDSDQSTSDMAIIACSKVTGAVPIDEFQTALDKVCVELAEDIVRNGEGTACDKSCGRWCQQQRRCTGSRQGSD